MALASEFLDCDSTDTISRQIYPMTASPHLPVPHRRDRKRFSSIQTLATHRRPEPSPLITRRQGGDPPLLAIHLHPIRFRHEARSPMRSKLLQHKRRRIRHGLGSLLESDACQAPRLPRDHGSGMESFARNCKSLKKLSCGSCDFGARGLNAVLEHCKVLEELSVKSIRGIHETAEAVRLHSSSSLRYICLKELVNGQVFESLVASRTLKKLRIICCLGNWDKVLQVNGDGNSSLTEIHLERLQTPECSNSGLVCVVERCGLLRKLHIDGWRTKRIGDEGLMALAKHCLLLQELVLIGVDATHASLSAIASNCKKLERLDLCGSSAIGDAEMACIAEKCVALRKFCIKGCPISDVGIKALALGCPNLVKLKVKKCIVVTGDVREWLRERRRTLVVSMDGDETKGPAVIGSEDGGRGLETVVEEVLTPVADGGGDTEIAAGGGGRLAMLKTKLLASKNFVAFTLRRWLQSEATGST
ncbi:hypothetical protein Bca4012_026090 [Brassica carinata]